MLLFAFALSDAAWRVVLLFALGVAPYAAPPEAIGSRTPLVASVRLAILLGIALALTLTVRRAGRRRPRLAVLAAATLALVPITAFVCAGERGPLARGAWVAAPLVWATIATALGGPLAARVARGADARGARRAAIGLFGLGAALGAASLALAAPMLGSRDALWTRALAMNPGDEHAARAVALRARERGEQGPALQIFASCRAARPSSCICAEGFAEDATDLGKYEGARAALDATITCTATARRLALTAEALVGTRAFDEGLRQADLALAQSPDEARAVYARGWATYLKGNPGAARADAKRAVELGRGVPARMLYAMLLISAGELDAAATELHAVLAAQPSSAQATYDLALIAQKKNQYRDAREGYLRALKLDPQMADARYNLVVLTRDLGATLEAQHHVDEFVAAYPNDPRILALRMLVATPPPRRALTVGN